MKQSNLDKGQAGEVKVIEKLTRQGLTVKDYTDYDKHKYKQHKGYDIEVLNPVTGELDRVDIKTNVKNNFLYLEALKKPNLGWFWTSSADLIYHYDMVGDNLYGYELKKMRNFIFKYDYKPTHGREKDLIGLEINETNIIKKL